MKPHGPFTNKGKIKHISVVGHYITVLHQGFERLLQYSGLVLQIGGQELDRGEMIHIFQDSIAHQIDAAIGSGEAGGFDIQKTDFSRIRLRTEGLAGFQDLLTIGSSEGIRGFNDSHDFFPKPRLTLFSVNRNQRSFAPFLQKTRAALSL